MLVKETGWLERFYFCDLTLNNLIVSMLSMLVAISGSGTGRRTLNPTYKPPIRSVVFPTLENTAINEQNTRPIWTAEKKKKSEIWEASVVWRQAYSYSKDMPEFHKCLVITFKTILLFQVPQKLAFEW